MTTFYKLSHIVAVEVLNQLIVKIHLVEFSLTSQAFEIDNEFIELCVHFLHFGSDYSFCCYYQFSTSQHQQHPC